MQKANLEFRKIPSLKFLYEVNSNGTVFRNVKSKKQSRIKLDMHHSSTGYYTTFVHVGGRKPNAYTKRVMIHSAVAECWLGPKPENMEIDHIDRNTHNNDYRNLRYVTKSEQMKNRDHSRISARGSLNLQKARETAKKPVAISKDGMTRFFDCKSACARYISDKVHKKLRTVMCRLSQERHFMYGYDVFYGNAETKHTGSKEQEIVHGSDLSYDNRFNSAKAAELKDRVTHA